MASISPEDKDKQNTQQDESFDDRKHFETFEKMKEDDSILHSEPHLPPINNFRATNDIIEEAMHKVVDDAMKQYDPPEETKDLYGNIRKWKDLDKEDKTPDDSSYQPKLASKVSNFDGKTSSFVQDLARIQTQSRAKTIDSIMEDRDRRADSKTLREARDYDYFIILPDDTLKSVWDFFITVVLLYTFFATPYRIAFVDKDDLTMTIVDYTIDFIFACDIVLNFFMAYYNSEYILIDTRQHIACHYLKTWFLVDFIAILPFNVLFQTSDFGALARLSRIPRLYRLFRMFRLMRLLKVARRKGEFSKYFGRLASIGIGIERLILFFITFLLFCHVIACGWVMLNQFDSEEPQTWIYQNDFQDLDNTELYLRAIYYTVTTITTVGFGDISPNTNIEMIFGIIVMISGVIVFSYATGSLSSILSNIDENAALLKEKIGVLDSIRSKYNIGPALYEELRQSIQYEVSKDVSTVVQFINDLPHRLKLELSVKIHRENVLSLPFFKEKPADFIAHIGPLLKSLRCKEGDYIYIENDVATKVYFLSTGICGFVLPEYQNTVYIIVEKGDIFGTIDVHFQNRNLTLLQRKRVFTLMALEECEMLTLDIQYLFEMEELFPQFFNELTFKALDKYKYSLRQKDAAIKESKQSKFLGTMRTHLAHKTSDIDLKKALNKYQVVKDYVKFNSLNAIIEEEAQDSLQSSYHDNELSGEAGIEDVPGPDLIDASPKMMNEEAQNGCCSPAFHADIKKEMRALDAKLNLIISHLNIKT